MSKAKYDRNNVTFGPDRSDLEYKLDRIEEKAEDFKTDLEPVTGIVDGYDPITGIIDVIVDPNLPSIPVGNGSGVYPNPGDTMIIQPIAGEYYGTGIVQEVQFPDHSLLRFVVPSSVAGLPRIPAVEYPYNGSSMQNRYMGSGDGYMFYLSNGTTLQQTNISGGGTTDYVFPGINTSTTSAPYYAGGAYTNGVTASGTNGTTEIYFMTGGVITTVTYAAGTEIKQGGWDGTYYWYCVIDSPVNTTKAVQVHGVTGVHTVNDITASYPAHTYAYHVCRAGNGYFIIWSGDNKSTAGSSIGMWVYNGVSATIYSGIDALTMINHPGVNNSSSSPTQRVTGAYNNSLSQLDIEGGYLYWLYRTSGITTGFYKMNLSTGTLTLYNNIFPVTLFNSTSTLASGTHTNYIGAIYNGTVVVASAVLKTDLGLPGPGYMSVFFITDGVTTTLFVSDGDEGYDADSHYALCSASSGATSGIGYVYYVLDGYDDYITGTPV